MKNEFIQFEFEITAKNERRDGKKKFVEIWFENERTIFFIDFVDTFVHIQITQYVTLLWEINRHKFVADVLCESAQYLQVDLPWF